MHISMTEGRPLVCQPQCRAFLWAGATEGPTVQLQPSTSTSDRAEGRTSSHRILRVMSVQEEEE